MAVTDTKRVKICKYSVTNSRFEDDYQHHFIFSHNESQHLRDPKHCDQNLKLIMALSFSYDDGEKNLSFFELESLGKLLASVRIRVQNRQILRTILTTILDYMILEYFTTMQSAGGSCRRLH